MDIEANLTLNSEIKTTHYPGCVLISFCRYSIHYNTRKNIFHLIVATNNFSKVIESIKKNECPYHIRLFVCEIILFRKFNGRTISGFDLYQHKPNIVFDKINIVIYSRMERYNDDFADFCVGQEGLTVQI